jgi:flavin-dependent dehydrogenase
LTTRFDVAVIGAGPAGSLCAHVLAQAGRRVALVEGAPPPARKIGESLIGAARPLLARHGLLDRVTAGPHQVARGNCSAWGSGELVTEDFITDPNGPGWHLDRPAFDAELRAAAMAAGAELLANHVDAVEAEDGEWHIDSDGEPISATWVVDATGRRASVARMLGGKRTRDDSLVAVYAWFAARENDAEGYTLIESAPDGWWYSACLPHGMRVAACHVDADMAVELAGTFATRLGVTHHIRKRLNGARMVDAPRTTEACGARLDTFVGDRWLAVGDAALSFDPLSSQGLFNALVTGSRAGLALDAALGGDAAPLADYARMLEEVRAQYVLNHRVYYAAEPRYALRPFWARRSRPAHTRNIAVAQTGHFATPVRS